MRILGCGVFIQTSNLKLPFTTKRSQRRISEGVVGKIEIQNKVLTNETWKRMSLGVAL